VFTEASNELIKEIIRISQVRKTLQTGMNVFIFKKGPSNPAGTAALVLWQHAHFVELRNVFFD
jgi:hypothetical protein